MERNVHGSAGCIACDRRAELCHWGQGVGWRDRLRSMPGSCQTDFYLVTRLERHSACLPHSQQLWSQAHP